MSLTRRSYKATTGLVVKSEDPQEPTITAVTNKAREGMKVLNSPSCKSILRDSLKALAEFIWKLSCLELKQTVPTLGSFLEHLLPKAKQNFAIAMILKMQCKQLFKFNRLCQWYCVEMEYTSRFFVCLMTLHFLSCYDQSIGACSLSWCKFDSVISLSVSATAKAVKDVSDNHDADVMSWANNLLRNIKVKE